MHFTFVNRPLIRSLREPLSWQNGTACRKIINLLLWGNLVQCFNSCSQTGCLKKKSALAAVALRSLVVSSKFLCVSVLRARNHHYVLCFFYFVVSVKPAELRIRSGILPLNVGFDQTSPCLSFISYWKKKINLKSSTEYWKAKTNRGKYTRKIEACCQFNTQKR